MISPERLELLKFLAARNVCDGILYEPRLYSQKFDFSTAGTLSPQVSDENLFVNGEQYPVRITHILAQIRDVDGGLSSDERLIQSYGLRVRSNDTYYMSGDLPTPMPLFHNVVTASANEAASRAVSTWRFPHPFFMGLRDTMDVKVELEYALNPVLEESLEVWVQFHGFGALSRRPKELHGLVTFTSVSPPLLTIPDSFFRNDGTEPLEVHSVDVFVKPPTMRNSGSASSVGNIRRARLSMRQVGNGTNQRWTNSDAVNVDTVPAGLFGVTTGRAVTHVLPVQTDSRGRGWIWEPNQGLTLEVTGPSAVPYLSELYVALVGEIIVK